MSTMEHPVIGPTEGHANNKALAALWLGIFAMANMIALVMLAAARMSTLDEMGGLWLLMPFFGFTAGVVAAYLGSIAWIDVRRGITDKRLFEAQFGALLGGLATVLVLLAIAALFVIAILMMLAFGADGNGWD